MASERRYQMERLTTRIKAREQALKIIRDRIQEIGATTPGWGVEILLAAYTYLIDGAPVEIINPFSTVEEWSNGIVWTPGMTDLSMSRKRNLIQ